MVFPQPRDGLLPPPAVATAVEVEALGVLVLRDEQRLVVQAVALAAERAVVRHQLRVRQDLLGDGVVCCPRREAQADR